MHLFCEKCHNLVGETGVDVAGHACVKISFKVRGAKRRIYIVKAIMSVECDYCGHCGKPLPGVLDTTTRRYAK